MNVDSSPNAVLPPAVSGFTASTEASLPRPSIAAAAAPFPLRSQPWLCFLLVGIVSSLGYVITMAVGVEAFGWRPTGAAVAAFAMGTLISYFGNTGWTFAVTPTSRNAMRFSVVVLAGLLLNVAMEWGLERFGFHHLVISLAVLGVVPIFNFLGHRFWTYAL